MSRVERPPTPYEQASAVVRALRRRGSDVVRRRSNWQTRAIWCARSAPPERILPFDVVVGPVDVRVGAWPIGQ